MSVSAVIALFLQYKYPALVVLSFFEGPYMMMMSGFLIKLGVLTIIPTYIALSIGDLLADTVWYYVGYFFGNKFVHRFGKFFDINATSIENAKELFSKHRKKILLGSKMTAGFGLSLATLITAGIVRAPFGEYIVLNFFGQLVWTTVMLAVGYFFGNLYVVIDNVAGKIFIIAIALLALYLLLRLSRRLGRKAKEAIGE
ncbi:MAG: DedA family protein [Candidatus Paceibacterota bacterium]|jgi:membrane protein DedA with SNARE-associated domain